MAKAKFTAKEKKDMKEFFEALRLMEQERGIPREFIAEKIADAITVASRKDYGGNDIVVCDIDTENETIEVFAKILRFPRKRLKRLTRNLLKRAFLKLKSTLKSSEELWLKTLKTTSVRAFARLKRIRYLPISRARTESLLRRLLSV